MGFKDLHECVVESPHGVRSAFVEGAGAVPVSDVERARHYLVASNSSPAFLSHFFFAAIKELVERGSETVLSSLDFGSIRTCGGYSLYQAYHVIAGVHDVIIPMGTNGVHGVQAETNGKHAQNGVGLLVPLTIDNNVRQATGLVRSLALHFRSPLFLGIAYRLERLSDVGQQKSNRLSSSIETEVVNLNVFIVVRSAMVSERPLAKLSSALSSFQDANRSWAHVNCTERVF